MKTTSHLMAGASRFAHLAGLTKGARASRAEDDRREDASAEEDEDEEHAEEDDTSNDEPKGKKGRKARAAEDDGDDEPKGKSSRRASDDDDDEEPKGKKGSRASDDDDDDDEEPRARGKRSRRAEEDDDRDAEDEDDDKEEMNGRSAKASARRREQARISHILGCSAAASNLPLAVSLACETRMTRKEAVAVLKGQADRAPQQERRGAREDRNPQLGTDGGSSKPKAGAGWDRSFTKLGIAPRG